MKQSIFCSLLVLVYSIFSTPVYASTDKGQHSSPDQDLVTQFENKIAQKIVSDATKDVDGIVEEPLSTRDQLIQASERLSVAIAHLNSVDDKRLNASNQLKIENLHYLKTTLDNQIAFFDIDHNLTPYRSPLISLRRFIDTGQIDSLPIADSRLLEEINNMTLNPSLDQVICSELVHSLVKHSDARSWIASAEWLSGQAEALMSDSQNMRFLDQIFFPKLNQAARKLDCTISHHPTAAEQAIYYHYKLGLETGSRQLPADILKQAMEYLEELDTRINAIVRFRYGTIEDQWPRVIKADNDNYLSDETLSWHSHLSLLSDITASLAAEVQSDANREAGTRSDNSSGKKSRASSAQPAAIEIRGTFDQSAVMMEYTIQQDDKRVLLVNLPILRRTPLFELKAQTAFYLIPGYHALLHSSNSIASTRFAPSAFRWGLAMMKTDALLSEAKQPLFIKLGLATLLNKLTCMAVVDIGIHTENWSQQKSIEFLQNHSTMDEYQATRLVNHIQLEPGHYAAAYIGYSELNRFLTGRDSREIADWTAAADQFGNIPLGLLTSLDKAITASSASD